ncbi:unnamed protein product [Urochloa humidicola]
MEGVAVSSMVIVAGSHGAVVSDTAIPSVISVEQADQVQIINGDAASVLTIAAAGIASTDDDEGSNNNVEPAKKDADDDDGTTTQCTTPVSGRSPSSTHRKRRGAFSLFRAVFQTSFGRSDSMKKTDCATSPAKKKAIVAAADTPAGGDTSPSWKTLLDGVRPLRLRGQELEYYPPPPPLGHGSADVYHDVLLPPPSPARSGFDFEEAGMTSRYASAQDLHQMDSGSGEAEEEEGATPHAIDMQAEEFIAKFYEQFKTESFDARAAAE